MRKILFLFLASLSMVLMAAPQPNIRYAIWTGNELVDVPYWANVGEAETETLTKQEVHNDHINGLYNPNDSCLHMYRTTADTWHGIGFDLQALTKTPGDANHFYILIRKSQAGPVKLEMQIDNGEDGYVQAWASADYTEIGKWQQLTFPMWEDDTFNANSDKLIKTIYLHVHDADASAGEPVEVEVGDFFAGYDMWNMPVFINCYDGWNDVSGYNNINTLNAYNNAEVGGEKEIANFNWYLTGANNQWQSLGAPKYLPVPDSVIGDVTDQQYAEDMYHLPILCRPVSDTLSFQWSDVTTNYNTDLVFSDGLQLVSNPVMQNFNAGALVNENTHVYLLNNDRYLPIDATEHVIPAMTSFFVFIGENAPQEILCDTGSGTAFVNVLKSGKSIKTIRDGQVLIYKDGNTYTIYGTQL